MKSTGIIRRIDELGRIVIPKEIRKNLKIRDGENIEIFVDDETIILKKYSKFDNFETYAKQLSSIVYSLTNKDIIITDREKILIVEGNVFSEIAGKSLHQTLMDIIDSRENIINSEEIELQITADYTKTGYFACIPIITAIEADSVGLVIIYSETNNLELKNYAKVISLLLSSTIDVLE